MLGNFGGAIMGAKYCFALQWERGHLLRRCGGQGAHAAKTMEPRGFSRVAAGFSSYDVDFRLPLVLALEAQTSLRVASESWGLCSSHCRAKETSSRHVSRT